jgi:ABC-type antimicrobial peptide transport system permease subunit
MSETFFSLNDLLRRKLQTTLVIASLALCAASTLFLLLLGDKIGFGLLSMAEDRLTASFSTVFSRFITFSGLLIFIVGVVIVYFMVFVMMSQRVRDIGLMKAAGCPNDLIFGYFMNELVIIALAGCLLGVVLGVVADYASSFLLRSVGMQVVQGSINLWLDLLVFVIFFLLSLIAGVKPILNTTRVESVKALSPSFSFGLSKESDFKGVAKAGLTLKLAVRSLFRRKSATLRIILCLTSVFILITVAVAGGIVANQTTKSWVEKAVGKDTVLIAHHDVGNQYKLLLSKFHEPAAASPFNYADEKYFIPDEILTQLESISSMNIDKRFIIEALIEEVQVYVLGTETTGTTTVGDHRKGVSLIVGVEPEKALGQWFLDGEPLSEDGASEAMVGDTIAKKMFSNPLVQNLTVLGRNLRVKGVCIDPINNGNVTYVPLKILQNAMGISNPNIAMAKINDSADCAAVLAQMTAAIKAVNPEFEVVELRETLDASLGLLDYMWSTIMFLPMLCLSAATMCLVGYVVLAISEQRQEFGVLRAVGARPSTIVKIVGVQNLLILLSSWATGIAFGTMVTLLVLIPEPLVTSHTIIEIAAWLLAALIAIFILSLYPVLKFSKKSILSILAQP